MGLSICYEIFIKWFLNIASPIIYFQNKGVKFEWTSKCEEIFQQLKDILTSVPILKIVDLDEYFEVWTDACKEGLGGVLTQKYQVVWYESRKLKENELISRISIHYSCTENVETLYHGKKFELRTNHYGLEHLFGQPTLNSRQTRWMEFLSEYDF
jgi:hypothetical protein